MIYYYFYNKIILKMYMNLYNGHRITLEGVLLSKPLKYWIIKKFSSRWKSNSTYLGREEDECHLLLKKGCYITSCTPHIGAKTAVIKEQKNTDPIVGCPFIWARLTTRGNHGHLRKLLYHVWINLVLWKFALARLVFKCSEA